MIDAPIVEISSTVIRDNIKNNKNIRPLLPHNVWEYVVGKRKEDSSAKGHPAPFPLKLAIDHIQSWTNKGDVVLDPMSGSGTVCIAAKVLERHYIGFDISAEYCDLAQKRMNEFVVPVDLFDS